MIVDVAIDQGGCVETARPTTHSDPVYIVDGVIHYCVANMPGGVPITSTKALTNATLPYVEAIADHGLAEAVSRDRALARGVNVLHGKITYEPVAEAHDLEYTPLETVLPLTPRLGVGLRLLRGREPHHEHRDPRRRADDHCHVDDETEESEDGAHADLE